MIKIKFSTIVKIQKATIRIFEEDSEPGYVDYRIVKSNERAIQHYLDTITSDKEVQSKILDIIESNNFNTKDITYKPICDELRELGFEVEND